MKKNLLFSKLLFVLATGILVAGELHAMHHSLSNMETERDKITPSSPQTPVLEKTRDQLLTELRQEKINMINQEIENFTKINKHAIKEIVHKELWEDLTNLLLHENTEIAQLSALNLSRLIKDFASREKYKTLINLLNAINPYTRDCEISTEIFTTIVAQAMVLAVDKRETPNEMHSRTKVAILCEIIDNKLLLIKDDMYILYRTFAQAFLLAIYDNTAIERLLKSIQIEECLIKSPEKKELIFSLLAYIIRDLADTETIKSAAITNLLINIEKHFPKKFTHILTKTINEIPNNKKLTTLFFAIKDLNQELSLPALENAFFMATKDNLPDQTKEERLTTLIRFIKFKS